MTLIRATFGIGGEGDFCNFCVYGMYGGLDPAICSCVLFRQKLAKDLEGRKVRCPACLASEVTE